MSLRIGHGIDVHRLVAGRPLLLGCVHVPYERGLAGHSDGDAVVHALCDALLGAAGLGDMGDHFPSSAERWRDTPGSEFLGAVAAMLREHDLRVVANPAERRVAIALERAPIGTKREATCVSVREGLARVRGRRQEREQRDRNSERPEDVHRGRAFTFERSETSGCRQRVAF